MKLLLTALYFSFFSLTKSCCLEPVDVQCADYVAGVNFSFYIQGNQTKRNKSNPPPSPPINTKQHKIKQSIRKCEPNRYGTNNNI